MSEFLKPTPQERIAELKDVARIMGNLPVSIIFKGDGSVTSSIGLPSSVFKDPVIPNSQSEIILPEQRAEGISEHRKKVMPPMKTNQRRHSENLSGLSGWYNGRYYVNGQPTERKEDNTNRRKKNGNGRH